MGAAADVVTGGLWGRAVEPAHGAAGHDAAAPGAKGHGAAGHGDANCLNCGTHLLGEFCHQCGQSGHVHRSLAAIGHDLLHGVFHFEGKIFHTLPMLLFRPGELTRRYVAGERARFVSPLALFLFTVFLLFASFGVLGPKDFSKGLSDGLSGMEIGIGDERREAQARLATLDGEAQAAAPGSDERVRLDRQRADLRQAIAASERVDAAAHGATGNAKLDAMFAKAKKNPALVLYKIQSNGYKYSWALILLSTPLVALLFLWRRGYKMYDHAVFVTYSITFISIWTVLAEVALTLNLSGWLVAPLVAWVPAHLYWQLRGAYRLRRFSAAWRMVMLLWMAAAVLVLFVLALVTLGLLG